MTEGPLGGAAFAVVVLALTGTSGLAEESNEQPQRRAATAKRSRRGRSDEKYRAVTCERRIVVGG